MSYRVELANTGRAGCRATHCQKEGTKIAKGELRQGTLVTIQEHTGFHWRHWGCVTPEVLHNWSETCQMDMELVDGYDDLPKKEQEKVKRALEQKHVDDADWNGDVEMNRYDPNSKKRGMFVKTPKQSKKKKAEEEEEGDPSEATPTKKKPAKKRARAAADEDDAEPVPKKAKGRAKKAKNEYDDAEPEEAPKKPAKKGRKAKDSVVEDAEAPPAPRATKGRKAKSAATVVDSDIIDDDEAPPPKKTKAKKATKAAAEDGDDVAEEVSAPAKKRKGRPKKAAAEEA